MAFLTTSEIGQNYGLTAKIDIVNFLIKKNFFIKVNNNYKLTKLGGKYGKIDYSEGRKRMRWDEEKFFPIMKEIKRDLIIQSKKDFKLYHMTHINNLQSVFTNGLLSHNTMKDYAYIDISDTAVNNRRSNIEPFFEKSIHDYVPFYYNVRNAMLNRVQREHGENIIILEIGLEASFEKYTLFTNQNASTLDVVFYNCIKEFLESVDWNTIYSWSWFEREIEVKQKMMAECLILNQVDRRFIKNVGSGSKSMLKKNRLRNLIE